MKKIVPQTLIGLLLLCTLIACQGQAKASDNAYLKDLSTALDERWTYLDETTDKDPLRLKNGIAKEIEHLEKYHDANDEVEFNDPRLKKLADDYYDALLTQEESLKYYENEFSRYSEKWQEGYDKRSTILTQLVDEYGLKVNEGEFESIRNNSQVVAEKNSLEEELNAIIATITFEDTTTEDDYHKVYSAVVENTTSTDFSSVTIRIKLLDEDGVTIGDEDIYISDWLAGERKKISFDTSLEFHELSWFLDNYNIK